MSINFPNIDPIIFSLGDTPLKVTWYSLSYVAGILLSFSYLHYLNRKSRLQPALSSQIIDNLMTWIILGIVIGGRLGYVIFYDLDYNLANPSNIIKTWQGGMSFHGGLLGVIISTFIYCHLNKISFLSMIDLFACAAPIGLFLGRIANFINAELVGRQTDAPWAIIFPGENFARHPSQLYEASTEGLLLFIIMRLIFIKSKIQTYKGCLSGIFLLFYAFFRFLIENYRQPDAHIGFISSSYTMGQILSIPMIITGIILILYSFKNATNH